MAARLRKTHQQSVKDKIRASQLVNALQNHVLGKNDMKQSQVAAAKVLLDKSISNAPTEIQAEVGGMLQININL